MIGENRLQLPIERVESSLAGSPVALAMQRFVVDLALQALDELFERHGADVALRAGPNRHGACALLLLAHNQHVGHFLQLGLANLETDLLRAEISLDAE